MMRNERWQRVETLFHEAVRLPPGSRASYVADHAPDEELRAEVDALLDAHASAGAFIESPAFGAPGAATLPQASELLARGTIGPYRLRRVIGHGGMGIVLEAEQMDPPRSVALKVVRETPGAEGRNVRFLRREVHTLARLSHPAIATIYDAGATPDGLHYFAMELVDGAQLDEYVRTRAPSRPERLELFIGIADAVSHAHQRGILHRDLKPANILVSRTVGDDSPAAKILDFGLARITGAADAPAVAASTVMDAGWIVGSLPYMSPEQTRRASADLDVRSDVYTLGVILYELLTGRLPYDLDGVPTPEATRIICEKAPIPPSRLDRSLRGDLETIVLKALEKDPDRRYAAAAALVDDLRRFRDRLPITARAPGAFDQLGRLVRRHRLVSSLVLGLLLTLIAFTTMTAVQNVRIRDERDHAREESQRAEREMIKAREIQAFLQGMLAEAMPEHAQGEEVTVRAVLDAAGERIDEEFLEQPEVEAALRFTIGSAYLRFAMFDDAERHLARAGELYRAVHAEPHGDLVRALLELGQLHRQRSENADAERLYREALDLARAVPDISDDTRLDLLNNLGTLKRATGDYDEAERLLTEALAERERVYGPDHIETALGLNNLGLVYNARHDYAASKPLFERSLAILSRQLPEEHPWLTSSIYNFAALLHRVGDIEGAEMQYRRALELDKKVLGPDHPNVAMTLNALGSVLESAGRHDEAEPLYRAALEIRLAKYGPRHRAVAESYNNIGLLLHRRGWYAPALEAQLEAVATLRAVFDEPYPGLARSLSNLTTTYRVLGRLEEAEAAIREAIEIHEAVSASDHPNRILSNMMLGTVLLDRGETQDAVLQLRAAQDAFLERLGPDHALTNAARGNLATALLETGDIEAFDEATALLNAGLESQRRRHGEDHATLANTMQRLAELAYARGAIDEAEALARDTVRRTEASLPPAHPDRERALDALAVILLAQGHETEALATLRDAVAVDARRRALVAERFPDLEVAMPISAPTQRTLASFADHFGAEPGSDAAEEFLRLREEVLARVDPPPGP